MENTYNFTQIDPSKFVWDDDYEYVQTAGKRHGFSDGYSIMVVPERCDGAPMNLGCRVIIKNDDTVEADFHLDSLGMQLISECIQGIMVEQLAARCILNEV